MKKHTDNINCHRKGVSTFAGHTSPGTDQSSQKSFHLSHADKIEVESGVMADVYFTMKPLS